MGKNSIYKTEKGKIEILSFYEEVLENWYKPNSKHIISTSYGKTFVIESGDKSNPTMILLHGSSSNSAMWIADVQEYSQNYHVFSIDIIGECGNSDETRPDFKSNHYSTWLNDIFNHFNISKAIIISCSLGGWIAMDFTIQFPNKVEKLILIATAGITQLKAKTIFFILITSMFGEWGFRKLNEMVYGNLEIDKTALEFASLLKKYYQPRADVLSIFPDSKLNVIQQQVLFIGGANDCFYDSQKTASRLQKLIQNFEGDILQNNGHVVVNQEKKILKFLRSGKLEGGSGKF